ncbi:MAG: hypothetical protein P4L67_02630 [Candidatus Pacebacteria bacterium]|nr:hypothetical protein [Candidatus Paceibacterota bacterium]
MQKNVEVQRTELMKIKDEFDAELIEQNEKLKKINAERDVLREMCQTLQKEIMKSAAVVPVAPAQVPAAAQQSH